MSFNFISAIIRGQWAIQKEYAEQIMPLVMKMVGGDHINFSDTAIEKPQIQNPIPLFNATAPGVFAVGVGTNLQSVPIESIAVVDLVGPVMKYGGPCSYGSTDYAATINALANAENIAAIILNIDSPGGQVAGTTLLADAVKAASTKKPVIAMIDDGIAASAAMWIASAATEIYCTKKSDAVGSIGVFTTLADFSGMYEQKGVKVRSIYATQSTDKNGPTREALAGNDEPLIAELDITAQDFIDTIKANRGERLTGEDWATGKMFRAKDAAKMGLIDGIKSFDQIIKRTQQLTTNKNSNMNITTTATVEQPVVAFAAIMSAAGIEQIALVENIGFGMDENAMNALESHLDAQNQAITERDNTIATLEQRVQELTANDQTEALNQANATITANQVEIDRLNARVAELENSADGDFAQTSKSGDQVGKTTTQFLTSFDLEKQALREKAGKV